MPREDLTADDDMKPKILTLTKVAQHLGIPKRTLYRMLRDNRFPVRPIPKTDPRKWSVDDVDSWVAGKYE